MGNGREWWRIMGNCWEWWAMGGNGWEWVEMVENVGEWVGMMDNCCSPSKELEKAGHRAAIFLVSPKAAMNLEF